MGRYATAAAFLFLLSVALFLLPGAATTQQEKVVSLLAQEPGSLPAARKLLATPQKQPPRLLEAGAYVIGESGDSSDNLALLKLLANRSHRVRQAALVAIQKIINPVNLHVPLRVRDREVLGPPAQIHRLEAAWPPALCGLLRDPSHLIRQIAAQTLGILRSAECVSELHRLIRSDPMEPVRFAAAHALDQVTGDAEDGDVEDFVDAQFLEAQRLPLVTVSRESGENSAQLGPFVRASWFNPQAKFTIPGGMPAHRQTIAKMWWTPTYVHIDVWCDDPEGAADGSDSLTLYLQPGNSSNVYRLEARPEANALEWQILGQSGASKSADASFGFRTRRTPEAWQATFQIPFRFLKATPAPREGDVWRANLIRVESHENGGGRAEISSWTHYHQGEPGPPRMGDLRFAAQSPMLALRPDGSNLHVSPFDDYSPAPYRNRPVDPKSEVRWGRLAPPEHLVHGVNGLNFSLTGSEPDTTPLELTVTARTGRQILASETLTPESTGPIPVSLSIPAEVPQRAVDLEIELLQPETGTPWFRTLLEDVPIVVPPVQVREYPLEIVAGKDSPWSYDASRKVRWEIRDLGPMLLSESYPMCLVLDQKGRLYGGTYPAGRLFSFDPAEGLVEDLGSPSPPHNHLHDLVIAPDGRVFGGLYRPEGRLFSYNPASRTTADLGVPVRGGFSATCKVSAWADERVFGVQRGHLFYLDAKSGEIVDKGSFLHRNQRYLPTNIVADAEGNLLGITGGRFFRYLPRTDHVLISDHGLIPEGEPDHEGGWILPGPGGKLYALYADGRLFRWEPEQGRLLQVAHYADVEPGPGVSIVITPTYELVVGRSGIMDAEKNVLLVYAPGRKPPQQLGNPIEGHLYLTAMIMAPGNVIYGVSTYRAYSLERTPIHVYSITRREE